MLLSDFARVAGAIGATTKKLEKERILAEYLHSLDDASLERAAVFFAGAPFPRNDERVSGVGWATIVDAVAAVAGVEHDVIYTATSSRGDLGDAVAEFLPDRRDRPVTLLELGEAIDRLASTSGSGAKREALIELFAKLTANEARYVVKLLQSELRIGLQEGLVESAIARAFDRPLAEVRRANMLTADLGATALLARAGELGNAAMRLFQPIALMLAQPEERAEDIVSQLGAGAVADDKYDGIRAQIHTDGSRVRIFSRTLDEITVRFPEIEQAARTLPACALDGEIVAFSDRILPFATLQSRIGRRKVTEKLLESAPVVFFAFDLLYDRDGAILDLPLHERLVRLRALLPTEGAIRAGYQTTVSSAAEIEAAFDAARRRANEGLVVKNPDSLYTPGRRGKSWLKFKKALATLDCVITAAEYGHGKRRGVLSDYTFAVWRGDELVNIGKAYSGVTDAEIEELTARLKEITTAQYGPVHVVKPEIVLEVAFDRLQESARHKSGYAMRFPRIAQVRRDKTVAEISTIDDVRRIYEGQLAREGGE